MNAQSKRPHSFQVQRAKERLDRFMWAESVLAYAKDNGVPITILAQELGIDRATLWRFRREFNRVKRDAAKANGRTQA